MNRNKPQECGDERGYNGWTNYETWNLKLWLDNDEGLYLDMTDQARMFVEDKEGDKNQAVIAMNIYLKDWVEETRPDLGASCWADLLGAAISEVNYYEIAESYITDAFGERQREHDANELEREWRE